jgi:hypothetical protein
MTEMLLLLLLLLDLADRGAHRRPSASAAPEGGPIKGLTGRLTD